ncbi:murein biosynthesis integral membrane protein MurJ [soil metagenome]
MEPSLDSTQVRPDPAELNTNSPPTSTVTVAALDNRGVAKAALIVMIFFVISRVLGLARVAIIGARFGTSAEYDAYLAAFSLPDLLFQLVAGGALGSAFIPTFSVYWTKSKPAEAWLLFSRVLNLVTLVLVAMAGLAALFATPLVHYVIAPGFSPAQQMLTANLMRWILLATIVFGASGLVMGALNAVQHFLLPAAAPIFYNLAIILGAALLAPYLGIYGLVIGVVVGSLMHLLVQLPGLWRVRARYTLVLDLKDAGVREVVRLMGPRMLGEFLEQTHFLVNTILASSLAAGSIGALNYAWLLMLLPQGIFAQSIATAVFPTFAAQIAANQPDAMRRSFGYTLRTVLFLTIPAAVGLFVLRAPLVGALFQRHSFSAESTAMVAYALQFYALGLTAHAVVEIAVRAFYALHDTFTPVAIGVAAMLLNIGLSFWWVHWLGYGGLALANTTATTIEMLVMLWLLRKRMGGIDGRSLVDSIVRNGLAAAAMGVALALWLHWLGTSPWPRLSSSTGLWLMTLGGVTLATTVYGLGCIILKSTELRPALATLLRRR